MDFCSECKYAKILEFTDGYKIHCTLKKDFKSKNIYSTINFGFKKYNAPACGCFEKDVKGR